MNNQLCFCGQPSFYCLRHTFICPACFISSVHKKIKYNLSFTKFPQSIILPYSNKKSFHIAKDSIKKIYHAKSNKKFFILKNDKLIKIFDAEIVGFSRTVLNFNTVNMLVLDGLVGLLEGKGRLVLEGLNEDFISDDVQYLNVLKGITNEEVNLYFGMLEGDFEVEEDKKSKLESVCEEFLNDMEDRNYSALITFYKTLKKI